MLLGWMLSLIFRPNITICIWVLLFRLVICGFMIPMVLNGFTLIPSFMFCPESIIVLLQIFPLPKGDFPIIVSPSINKSALLMIINERVVWTRYTYRKIFRPYSYSQQRDMFHPSTVHVLCLIRRLLLSGIFTNQSGQWWFQYISNVIFVRFINVRRIYINLIACNFLLFTRNLFNLSFCSFILFARILFYLTACF